MSTPTWKTPTISGNTAYGTTGNSDTDQDEGFYLRGMRMNIDGNTSYKVGNALGNGIIIDSANQLSLTNNLTYNNATGISISTPQATISGNESRNNTTGMYVTDSDATARAQDLQQQPARQRQWDPTGRQR